VAALDRTSPRDRGVEAQLSTLWQQASIAFYGIDGQLAERLQLKAEYWTQPEQWSDQQVADANISLQRVAEYTRQLLHEG
jgi:hypothetical protein